MSAILKLKTINGRPVLRGYEHIWSVILDLTRGAETFTKHAVDQACCDPGDHGVSDYLRRLIKAGIVAPAGEVAAGSGGRYRRKVYRLVRRQDDAPRLRRDGSEVMRTGQELMWATMRHLLRDGFTAKDLVTFASTDEISISEVTAKSYLKHLTAAGYLQCLQPGRPRHLTRWRLKPAMNSGPKPPKILRTQIVYDPNTNALHGPAEVVAEEVAP
jgi:hypothetical protein